MPRRASRRDLTETVARLRTELHRSRSENQQLRHENEILRDAAEPLIHQAPARDRFRFIHARRGRFSVKRLCRVLLTDRGHYTAIFTRAPTTVSAGIPGPRNTVPVRHLRCVYPVL